MGFIELPYRVLMYSIFVELSRTVVFFAMDQIGWTFVSL
jgi:hypothetical protein